MIYSIQNIRDELSSLHIYILLFTRINNNKYLYIFISCLVRIRFYSCIIQNAMNNSKQESETNLFFFLFWPCHTCIWNTKDPVSAIPIFFSNFIIVRKELVCVLLLLICAPFAWRTPTAGADCNYWHQQTHQVGLWCLPSLDVICPSLVPLVFVLVTSFDRQN